MDKLPQISEAEYEIMKIIWDESPISTNSICEKVPSIHNWSNKTVHTLLSRLVSKHVISYEQKGRMYYYFPIISKINIYHKRTIIFYLAFMMVKWLRYYLPYYPMPNYLTAI
mgnify:FL=1